MQYDVPTVSQTCRVRLQCYLTALLLLPAIDCDYGLVDYHHLFF